MEQMHSLLCKRLNPHREPKKAKATKAKRLSGLHLRLRISTGKCKITT